MEANKHIEDNLTALVTKVDADTCHIVLYKHTSRGEICLNNKLVTCGYATISDPEKCIFNKQNTRKLPIKPIQMNNRNVSTTCFDKIIIINIILFKYLVNKYCCYR